MKLTKLFEFEITGGEYYDNPSEFNDALQPSWHAKLFNGFRVYTVKDKPIAVYCQKHQDGYIFKDENVFTGSIMDLIDAFEKFKR